MIQELSYHQYRPEITNEMKRSLLPLGRGLRSTVEDALLLPTQQPWVQILALSKNFLFTAHFVDSIKIEPIKC